MSNERVYRKKPVQGRSVTTVDTILQAAAQLLEKKGEAAITTTNVALRAGVSIGTLYQYFKNRDAILLGIAERERNIFRKHMQRILSRPGALSLEPNREFIRLLINSFASRRGAKRQFALLASMILETQHAQPLLKEIVAVVLEHWEFYAPSRNQQMIQTRQIKAFVMTRAILGVLQRAALEEVSFIQSPEFEDALCQIIITFSPLSETQV